MCVCVCVYRNMRTLTHLTNIKDIKGLQAWAWMGLIEPTRIWVWHVWAQHSRPHMNRFTSCERKCVCMCVCVCACARVRKRRKQKAKLVGEGRHLHGLAQHTVHHQTWQQHFLRLPMWVLLHFAQPREREGGREGGREGKRERQRDEWKK